MSRKNKILEKILSGTSDANIDFRAMCNLLTKMGFDSRIKGSHYIFTKDDIVEILNLQSKSGKAKPYQVKQVRNIILKYKLGVENVR